MMAGIAHILLGLLFTAAQAWKAVTLGQGAALLNAWLEASSLRVPLSVTNHIVEEVGEGSVGDYVATRWTGTKTKCSKLCKLGLVTINSRKVYATQRLNIGDVLEIASMEESPTNAQQSADPGRLVDYYNHLVSMLPPNASSVLFEDDDLAIVFKPAGTHSLAWLNTLKSNSLSFDSILPLLLAPSPCPDCLPRPIPCHRLDARVSGCLVVAKTHSALAATNTHFERREVHKQYVAVCCGDVLAALSSPPTPAPVPAPGPGPVEVFSLELLSSSSPSSSPSSLFRLTSTIDGAEAVTDLSVAMTVPSAQYGRLSLCLLSPITGRRHQLRRHAALLGCPIVGDDLFHSQAQAQSGSGAGQPLRRGEGLFLASVAVSLPHPKSPERLVKANIPIPAKFTRLLDRAESGASFQK
jgi:23S rRNA-/tRNA-specific pseudouridylate synthase